MKILLSSRLQRPTGAMRAFRIRAQPIQPSQRAAPLPGVAVPLSPRVAADLEQRLTRTAPVEGGFARLISSASILRSIRQ